MSDAFCRWCGTSMVDHPQVHCRRELDPPRFCPECGRRLRVQVRTMGYVAVCRDHGSLTDRPTD